MKNIILFIITAMAHAIASLLGLRSWAKAKKADENLYLTEEDYSFMRMFPNGTALARCHVVSGKPEVWSPSGSETTRTESDWHPPVGHYSTKVHVPRPAGSVMMSANVSVYPNKGVSNPELKPSIGRRKARFYMDREARQHIAEEVDMWNRGMNIPELVHRLKAGHKELTEEGIFCVAVATEGHFSSEVTTYHPNVSQHPDFDGCLDTACN